MGDDAVANGAEADRDYAELLVTLSFDSIKFLITLFVSSIPLYLVFFTAFVAMETSRIFDGPIKAHFKLILVGLTVFLCAYAWVIYYLVIKASARFLRYLCSLAPRSEWGGLENSRQTFVTVGTVACLCGTVSLMLLTLWVIRL